MTSRHMHVRVVYYDNYLILQHFIANHSATSLLGPQKATSEDLNFKNFLGSMLPDPPQAVFSTHYVTNDWVSPLTKNIPDG